MRALDHLLKERLAQLRAQGLDRELRTLTTAQGAKVEMEGRELINFGSNDYLGLANHPGVKAAAVEAIERFGAGAGASRLICGSMAPHRELEEQIAAFKGLEAALCFASGYAAALGTICALCGKDDVIVLDKLVHASIVDAARLSGAKLRVFTHNDLNELEDILKWADARRASHDRSSQQTLIITESLFSMDGDCSPLEEMVRLKEKYGAWLMVDEAHAVGVYGKAGRGLADATGVGAQIEVQMGTLGKALGSAGGYICGSKVLIDYLINKARSFVFSTAPVPAAAAAATAGIRLSQSSTGEQLRAQLRQNLAQLKSECCSPNLRAHTQIAPFRIGDEARAVQVSTSLRDHGLFVPAVRYPTVARGQARLRISLTAAHTASQIHQLAHALIKLPTSNVQLSTSNQTLTKI